MANHNIVANGGFLVSALVFADADVEGAEEEVLAELQRLAAQRDPDAPPVQLGVFPDGQFQQSEGKVYYNTGWASPGL